MKTSEEKVTAKQAAEWLDNMLENRPVKQGHLARLINAFEEDRFTKDPKPLVVTHDNKLVDGQHRLLAQVRTNKTHTYFVCRLTKNDSPLDVRMHESASRPHSNVDLLRFDRPDLTNFSVWASMAKMLHHLEYDISPTRPIDYYDIKDTMSSFKKELTWAVDMTMGATLRRLVPANFGAFCVWAMVPYNKKGKDLSENVKNFASKYIDGVGLKHNDPELVLRNYMLQRDTVDRIDELSRYASTFVAVLNGQNRSRTMRSRQAFEELAELINKSCPTWIRGARNPAKEEKEEKVA